MQMYANHIQIHIQIASGVPLHLLERMLGVLCYCFGLCQPLYLPSQKGPTWKDGGVYEVLWSKINFKIPGSEAHTQPAGPFHRQHLTTYHDAGAAPLGPQRCKGSLGSSFQGVKCPPSLHLASCAKLSGGRATRVTDSVE